MKSKKRPMGPTTLLMLVVAVGLLAFSGIGGARAALNIISETVAVRFATRDMSVRILENGKKLENDTLLSGMDETIQPGKAYDEALTVQNDGEIEEYVRMTLYRYWTVGENRQTTLTPGLIDFGSPGQGWVEDASASTPERSVFYYTTPLAPGETTQPLCSSLTISPDVLSSVTLSEDGTAATYDYNGTSFVFQAEADSVQARSAEEAIRSAWGIQVSVDDSGSLKLEQ